MHDTEEKIKVMQAFLDGKVIEVCAHGASGWYSTQGPSWDWGSKKYRIAEAKDSVDWSEVPRGFNYMARDLDGDVFVRISKPEIGPDFWCWCDNNKNYLINREGQPPLLKSYKRGSCDWDDSLVIRPGAE